MTRLRCPSCNRPGFETREQVVDHMVTDHPPAVLADALLNANGQRRCTRPVFTTEHAAATAAMAAPPAPPPPRRRPYLCGFCRRWHLSGPRITERTDR